MKMKMERHTHTNTVLIERDYFMNNNYLDSFFFLFLLTYLNQANNNKNFVH